MLHISLLSMNSLNKTQTAIFTLLLHLLLPEDHNTRNYLFEPQTENANDLKSTLEHNVLKVTQLDNNWQSDSVIVEYRLGQRNDIANVWLLSSSVQQLKSIYFILVVTRYVVFGYRRSLHRVNVTF